MRQARDLFLFYRALIGALALLLPKHFRFRAIAPPQKPQLASVRFAKRLSSALFLVIATPAFSQWENLADFSDDTLPQADQAEDVAPLSRAELKAKEFFRAVNDPELMAELDAEYQAIQELLQSGNTFNHNLAERYFSYSQLLREAGRLDEAASALVDALHIQKANYGLYDVRHRALLDALFSINFERNRPEVAEDYLQRLLLVERQIDVKSEARLFDMLVQMGHYYINRHLDSTSGSDIALESIDTALGYFKLAMREFKGADLSERLLPYGEYAYGSYLRKKELENHQAQIGNELNPGAANRSLMEREIRMTGLTYANRSFENSVKVLERFKTAAYEQGHQAYIVRAWVSLGDAHLLFMRERAAYELYAKAWEEAQKLPDAHPERVQLGKINKLPNFLFSRPWERTISEGRERLVVPLVISVNRYGRIVKIEAPDGATIPTPIFSRAKRTLRNLVFRPGIENGQPIAAEQQPYEVELMVKSVWLDKVLKRVGETTGE